jgi:hypothetical protein
MLPDTLTLADTVDAKTFTKVSVGPGASEYVNQAAASGVLSGISVRQSVDKSNKRRALFRINYRPAPTDALPNPQQASCYVVCEYTTSQVDSYTNCLNALETVRNFLATANAAKVLKGEV